SQSGLGFHQHTGLTQYTVSHAVDWYIPVAVSAERSALPQRYPTRAASGVCITTDFFVSATMPARSGMAQCRAYTAHGHIAVRHLAGCGLYCADDVLPWNGLLLRRTPCADEQPAFRADHPRDIPTGLLADTIIDSCSRIWYTEYK